MLEDSSVILHTAHEDISVIAVNYYKDLLGRALIKGNFPPDIELPRIRRHIRIGL